VPTASKSSSKPATVEGLDDDDLWSQLISDNAVPPMKVKGVVLHQPTKAQVDAWRQATTVEDGERALFGEAYEAIHAIFKDEPEYVWENFNIVYLKHMFGAGDENQLGK